MAPWVKKVFINFLPKLLFIKRPQYNFETSRKLLGDSQFCFYPYYSTTHLEQSSPFSRAHSKDDLTPTSLSRSGPFGSCQIHGSMPMPQSESDDLSNMPDIDNASGGIKSPIINNPAFSHSKCPPEIHRSCFCVRFIAEHTKLLEDSTKTKEDWKYVAMVLDRLFLWIFTLAVLAGTAGIILQAPTLYDDRIPIDKKCSEYEPGAAPIGRCPEQ